MTFLKESEDCKLLFSAENKSAGQHDKRTYPKTRHLLYGIITCLALLLLLLFTAVTAPYFTSVGSTTASRSYSTAELASDEILVYELEKMANELADQAERLQEEIRELDIAATIPVKPKTRVADAQLCYLMPNEQRFECLPKGNKTQSICEGRGCCWNAPSTKTGKRSDKMTAGYQDVPYCYYPFDYPSYNLATYEETPNGFHGILQRDSRAVDVYPSPVLQLRLDVTFETPQRLRVKITDQVNERYEVPLPVLPDPPATKPDQTLYAFKVSKNPFSFQITRKDTGTVIFDTSAGGFAFYDQFIEVASYLPSRFIYGLGEHTDTHFLHSVQWTKFTFWTTDTGPDKQTPLYGDHPFYLNMEEDGRANGVLLFNSNAMDVILQPAPAITYRTIGGVLDFHVFLGPSPKEVVSQYIEMIGKPALPPYWALGYHLCRWGYNSLTETKRIMERNIAAQIPLDTQWNDIDYMDTWKDFTVNTNFTGLSAFVDDLHKRGMHYVVITDPGISSVEPAHTYPPYDHGVSMNCFVKNASNQIIEGRVWTGKSQAYPDFTHPNASAYWTTEIVNFMNLAHIDGLWIDMNEPSNFVDGSVYGCPKSPLESPPYLPQIEGAILATRTLCMTAKHYQGLHYNLHSMYGLYEAAVTRSAFITINANKRPFVLSRSSFVGQGQYSAHWNGDASADWSHLQTSIGDILNFNMFGVPFVGADICGFSGDTTPELCLRWHQVGAFYPFARNHNNYGDVDQDPAAFTGIVLDGIRSVLLTRYRLLPYFNSLFFRASMNGTTVVRPLLFEYPHDPRTYSVDGQFLVGSSLMISPVVTQGTTSLLAYFPAEVWYDFFTGLPVDGQGTWVNLAAPLDHVNIHIRGGSIIPMQQPNTTTTASRLNSFELLVALNANNTACGELFWDDGEQLDVLEKGGYSLVHFSLVDNILTSKVTLAGFSDIPALDVLTVFGMSEPKFVLIGGSYVTFTYDANGVLRVLSLGLNLTSEFTIRFVFRGDQ